MGTPSSDNEVKNRGEFMEVVFRTFQMEEGEQ